MRHITLVFLLTFVCTVHASDISITGFQISQSQLNQIENDLDSNLPEAHVVFTVEKHLVSDRMLYTVYADVTTPTRKKVRGKYAWFGFNMYEQARCALTDAIKQLQ